METENTYLNRMYGKRTPSSGQSSSDKNPNRVTGGLRAQGVDRFTMIAEDGSSQELPSLAYVRSLEEQSRKQRAALDILERKLARQEAAIENLSAVINRRS